MRLRWKWILGLIGLVLAGSATAQNAGGSGKGGGGPGGDTDVAAETNATEITTRPPLTGNPQIDYIYDPNLPHEVRGYDLSDYPFYSRLPEDLSLPTFNFSCEERHDGFYASVPHKCQVYHNCLFGQRYDFLCANYTVFDQKNFICHYVSEVDCANSARHYDRNDELYETTTTTTTTRAPPQVIYVERPRPLRGPGLIRPNRPRPFAGNRPRPFGGNIGRPGKRRTTTTTASPAYYDDYYYDDYYDQYYDYYYNDYANAKTTTTTTTTTTPRPRRPNRPQRQRLGDQGGGGGGAGGDLRSRPSGRFGNVFSVKDRKRPRINPPVPVDDASSGQRPRASRLQQSSPSRTQAVEDAPVDEPHQDIGQNAPSGPRRRRPGGRKPRPGGRPPKKTTTTTTTTTTEAAPEDEYYYDDDYYYDYADEPSTTAAPARASRPSSSRTRSRGGSQRRPQESPSTTTTTEKPTTKAPQGRPTRPGRVNVRRNPISSRNPPVPGAVSAEERPDPAPTQETSGSQREQSQRLRPQFPRKRPQSQSGFGGRQEAEIIEEAAPLAPGVELPGDEAPSGTVNDQEVSETSDNAQSRSRTPIRRLGQSRPGRRRPGQRERGQQRRPTPVSDYYDY